MLQSINGRVADLEAELEVAKLIQAKYPNAYQHKVGKFLAWVSPDVGPADVTDFILVTDETCPGIWAFRTLEGHSNARVFMSQGMALSFLVSDMKAPMLECVKKHLGKTQS